MSNNLSHLRNALEKAMDNRIEAENDWNHIKNTATDTTKLIGTIRL